MLTPMSGIFLKTCINCFVASCSFGKEQTRGGHLLQQSCLQGRKGEDVVEPRRAGTVPQGNTRRKDGWRTRIMSVTGFLCGA